MLMGSCTSGLVEMERCGDALRDTSGWVIDGSDGKAWFSTLLSADTVAAEILRRKAMFDDGPHTLLVAC